MALTYKISSWLESTLFRPRGFFSYIFIFLFLPLSFIYGVVLFFRRILAKSKDLGIKVISVGNITIGGNGKTPFLISLSKEFEDVYIVSRGYGRKTKGLIEVSKNGEVFCSVDECGDEAYLLAKSCPNTSVIVSEDREKAILKAKSSGAKIVLLDDGFSKVNIQKIDILLHSKKLPTFPFTLPSGSYREFPFMKVVADLNLVEEVDFKREVTIAHENCDLILITSISKPQRLDEFLPKNVKNRFYFPDHHVFLEEEIQTLMRVCPECKILCTQKDAVKLENFGFELVVMQLEVKITTSVIDKIKLLVKSY